MFIVHRYKYKPTRQFWQTLTHTKPKSMILCIEYKSIWILLQIEVHLKIERGKTLEKIMLTLFKSFSKWIFAYLMGKTIKYSFHCEDLFPDLKQAVSLTNIGLWSYGQPKKWSLKETQNPSWHKYQNSLVSSKWCVSQQLSKSYTSKLPLSETSSSLTFESYYRKQISLPLYFAQSSLLHYAWMGGGGGLEMYKRWWLVASASYILLLDADTVERTFDIHELTWKLKNIG